MKVEINPDQLAGCLLGMAIGDALGLPCEGLKPGRQKRLFPDLNGYHFCMGHGMISDDTEHACMTALALMVQPHDGQAFARKLGWQLRWWLLGLPAGVGLATLRACVRLWLGWPAQRSGVVSAGNGPAMRAVLLGVAQGQDFQILREFVIVATEITHRDPRALAGALAIALAAWMESQGQRDPQLFLEQFEQLCPEPVAFVELLQATVEHLDQPLEEFLSWLNCQNGISGYMLHTVPAVIRFWLKAEGDFKTSLISAIRCGGDTDTVAAILGGILGAGSGRQGLPADLLEGLWEWPRSQAWIEELAHLLAKALKGEPSKPPRLNPIFLLGRNLLFMLIVLLHGFRRLAPPY